MYEICLGFNTKQWWVYDNREDVYIDPPKEVLDYINNFDVDRQYEELKRIVACHPEWLDDGDYWYDDIEI